MYYNYKTREIKSKKDLQALFHCSIPSDKEKIGDWYLVHDEEVPSYDTLLYVASLSNVVFEGEKAVRKYTLTKRTDEELTSIKLSQIHSECDDKLNRTDYLMNTDYDGTGYDNQEYMDAVKDARSIWRKLRQTDEVTDTVIPEIPSVKDYLQTEDSHVTE